MINRDFAPDWLSPPGDTILELLSRKSMTVSDLAQVTELPIETAKDLVDGRYAITIDIARKLESVIGGSVPFWIDRDVQYRNDALRLGGFGNDWEKDFPLAELIRIGWLKRSPRPDEERTAILDFFGISSFMKLREKYEFVYDATRFRTSSTFESNPTAIAAWLRQGEVEAQELPLEKWNPSKFEANLSKIRKLTFIKSPRKFLPELKRLCSDCGVAVVLVRAPVACKASGATRFLDEDRAILQLSGRYLSDDHLWFTFFHEAGHLLLHGKQGIFLEGVESIDDKLEQEANHFASRVIVPDEYQDEMRNLPLNTRAIIRFGVKVGIAPGIVVGQLQHLGIIRHNQLNGLKRRYHWSEQ